MVAFALSIYGLVVIFLGMLGYIEMVVVDTFKQIQHGSNREGRFLGCAPLLYIWVRSHIFCEGITFIKSYFLGETPITEFSQNTWSPPETKEWWVSSLRD